jgi:hypothetical protein
MNEPKLFDATVMEAMVVKAKADVEHWKRIAIYLAHCHAATAGYDGQLSSVSSARKKRYADICRTAVTLLSGEESPKRSGSHRTIDDELADVIDRLTKGIEFAGQSAQATASCTPREPCGDCWECGPISPREAQRLHDQAETLSIKTIRRIAQLRLQREWLASAKKRTIVRTFREALQGIIDGEDEGGSGAL